MRLDGILRRSDGSATVWLNGRPAPPVGARRSANGTGAKVLLPDGRRIELRSATPLKCGRLATRLPPELRHETCARHHPCPQCWFSCSLAPSPRPRRIPNSSRTSSPSASADHPGGSRMHAPRSIGYALALSAHPSDQSATGLAALPDLDNDGSSDTCVQPDAFSIGRFPFRTVGLPKLLDGSGNCLWYAVAGRYKNNPDSASPVQLRYARTVQPGEQQRQPTQRRNQRARGGCGGTCSPIGSAGGTITKRQLAPLSPAATIRRSR